MSKKFAEWIDNFVTDFASSDEAGLVAQAGEQPEPEVGGNDFNGADTAHVDEAEQDARMESNDADNFGAENHPSPNPDDKHFQDGEKVSEKAFEDANKRDMGDPMERYKKAFDAEQLQKLGDAVADEILAEITSNALTPAEEMLNKEIPLAQLADVVASIEDQLRQNGIRRALFAKIRQRLAETLNVTLPIEISVGQPTTEGDEPAEDMGMDMFDLPMEEAPMEEAPSEDEEAMEIESEDTMADTMDDMIPDNVLANKANRFSKKA